MFIKQISVFVENRAGELCRLIDALGNNEIDISALTIADSADYGIVRMIVNDTDKAIKIAEGLNFAAKATEVLAMSIDDTKGGLAKALKILQQYNISISYMYAFVAGKDNKALMVLKVDKPEEAYSVLLSHNVAMVAAKDLYRL